MVALRGGSEWLLAEHDLRTERTVPGSLDSTGLLQWLVFAAVPKALPPPGPPPLIR